MKQNTQVVSVDMKKQGASDVITVNFAVIDSRDTSWQNLVLEHHRQLAHEMPEIVFNQHILVIYLNEYKTELKMSDRHVSKTA